MVINEFKARLQPPASWKDTKEAYKKKYGEKILEDVVSLTKMLFFLWYREGKKIRI